MDIFNEFATNDSLETDGVWVEIGDAKFLIASSGNKKFTKKLSRMWDRNKKILERKGDVADELSDKLMVEVLAETILLDWDNVTYKGKKFPYSVENAKTLLEHKQFRKQIASESENSALYKAVQEEEEAKN